MAVLDPRGAAPLGPMQIPIGEMLIYENFAVDVKEGRIPNTNTDHYIQIALISKGQAILLPVTPPFLRALGRQCNLAGDPKPAPRPKEGM